MATAHGLELTFGNNATGNSESLRELSVTLHLEEMGSQWEVPPTESMLSLASWTESPPFSDSRLSTGQRFKSLHRLLLPLPSTSAGTPGLPVRPEVRLQP